jgi:1,4-dihydroxy-2-naphthoate octaprenyltransferase
MDDIRIPLKSEALNDALKYGRINHSHGWVAQIIQDSDVVFRQVSEAPPKLIFRLFKSIRAISLTATLLPAIATALLCINLGFTLDVFILTAAVMGVLFLQVAVNVFNDVEDYFKLIDLPGSLGGSGVIQSAWFNAKQMQTIAWGALCLACVCGLPAVLKYPVHISVIALIAGIGVIGYSGKPFRFKYRALGDLLVFLLCGPALTMGIAIAATGNVHPLVIILGGYFGFIACGILNANNLNDIRVDVASGSKTLASVLGFNRARWLQVAYYLAALVSLIILSFYIGPWVLLPIVLLPVLFRHLIIIFKAQDSDHNSLKEIRFDAAKLHLLLSVTVCIGLII